MLLLMFKICSLRFLDIDECAWNSTRCQENCANTEGSFECTYRHGYTLADDGYSCEGNTNVLIY